MNQQYEGYDMSFISMLELVWGKGFIAPGGEGNVDRIVQGLDLNGKKVLELGSGTGGGGLILAGKYGAQVVGLEIEAPLVEHAQQLANEAGLADKVEFRHVQPGVLPIADDSMDVLYTSGVVCHIEDKTEAFRDALRVLKSGGVIVGYDWLKGTQELSENMHTWMKASGLHIFPDTLHNYAGYLSDAGFVDVSTDDASEWYMQRAAEEYAQMTGPLYEKMAKLGQIEVLDALIEEWRAMGVVLESGELRSGYFRGTKP